LAPFFRPGVAAEGSIIAFLEREPNENFGGASLDLNGDGDGNDTVLRVFPAR
jgi:hypothetical protein